MPKDEDIEDFAPAKYWTFPVNELSPPNKLVREEDDLKSPVAAYEYKTTHNPRFRHQIQDSYRIKSSTDIVSTSTSSTTATPNSLKH